MLWLVWTTSYSVHQRLKEIGIRKVLEAFVSNIVITLSKDFILLIIIGIVIAFPVAWWAITKWLQNFTYRTDVNWVSIL